MKFPSREEQAAIVRKRAETGALLEALRREKLRGMPFVWQDVDALLQLGDHCGLPSRSTSGMIEMQRLFMKLRPRMDGAAALDPMEGESK